MHLGGTLKELSGYRMEKSRQNLALAHDLYRDRSYGFALNRAYYAAFDAIRAVNALDDFLLVRLHHLQTVMILKLLFQV